MNAWPVQDAKARFSEFIEACIATGPQLLTKRGVEAAVLVSVAQWRQMQTPTTPSLKQLLLDDTARGELTIPPRGQARRRNTETF